MLAIWPMIQAFFVVLGVVVFLFILYKVVKKISKAAALRNLAQDAREENLPRAWRFVNAYGPQQAEGDRLMTYPEALNFLKEHIECPFVRADRERGLIFFDGRKFGR